MTKLPHMDVPEPPAPLVPPPPVKQPGKMRTYIIFGVIAVFLGVVLYMTRNNQSAGDLAVGQCFDRPATSDSVTTVVNRACTEPHDAEVFLVAEYPGGDSSTAASQINQYIDTACETPFQIYVGVSINETADYNYGWFYPSEDGWNSGDRTFTCYVDRADGGKLTTSVKAAGNS
jgi:hypothetical protein